MKEEEERMKGEEGRMKGEGKRMIILFSYRGYNCCFLFFRYLQWRELTGH